MIVLFLLWIVFNGRLGLDVLLLGIALCLLFSVLLNRAMGYSVKTELRYIARLPEILRYVGVLTWEVIKSGIAVSRIILLKDAKICSQLTFFTPDLTTTGGRVALGNSITLTPGTITVQLKNGRYCVHTIRDEYIDGIETSSLEKGVKRLEAKLK